MGQGLWRCVGLALALGGCNQLFAYQPLHDAAPRFDAPPSHRDGWRLSDVGLEARPDAPPDAAIRDSEARADGRCPDACGPDAAKPDVGKTDAVKLDAAKPDSHDAMSADGWVAPGTWISIAAGTYTMGSPTSEGCRFADETSRSVTLTHPFLISSTEVTQAQFQSVMGYNPGSPSCGGSCPVEKVTWDEAAAFCDKLSTLAKLPQCYSCTGSGQQTACLSTPGYSGPAVYTCPGYRLPTEAEWEWAYRAGTTTPYYNGPNDPAACVTCNPADAVAGQIAWYTCNIKQPTAVG